MSIHIGAPAGAIAPTVFLPGDPLRAEYIATTFLTEVVQYNTVRNMFGFTGRAPNGQLVSVQGSGMGMPSLSIYVNELIDQYGAQNIIRIGTAGSLQPGIRTRDIVLAQGACSESNMNRRRFKGMDFAPVADFALLYKAYEAARKLLLSVCVGNILSADLFYGDDLEEWKTWAAAGVLAVEMESAELYTLAARKRVRALSILTISDELVTHEQISAEDRQKSLADMVRIALEIV